MIVFHHREDGGCGGTLVAHVRPSNPESTLARFSFTLLSLVTEQLDVSTIHPSFKKNVFGLLCSFVNNVSCKTFLLKNEGSWLKISIAPICILFLRNTNMWICLACAIKY